MTLEEIAQEVRRVRPALDPKERKDGYAIYHSSGSRVVRLSRTRNAGVFALKRVATSLALGVEDERRFDGTFSELLSILDEEVAIIEGTQPPASPTVPRPSSPTRQPAGRTRSDTPASQPLTVRPPSKRAWAHGFDPKEVVIPGVDLARPFIYRWQIFNEAGSLVGIYIGKAGHGRNPPYRRVERYWIRVRGIQEGKPYSRSKPDEPYRDIQLALAAAVVARHNVVLTYVRNILPGESINTVESQLIEEHDSYGPMPHQLNRRA